MLEFTYFEQYQEDGLTKLAEKKLLIETRIDQFKNDKNIPNPTDDEDAYFFAISINGMREDVTMFMPWEEWMNPMDLEEATIYLNQIVEQTKLNFNAK